MPYKIPSLAGQPYRPSNGTEGDMFQEQFCERCKRDAKFRETLWGDDSCPILRDTLIYELEDAGYPKEWTHTAEGEPTCTAFEAEKP